ncbi:hypothetical protein GCM10027176_15210 [Actinoallomurus bryophytorum]|uniref:Uncharacterized protein n=1 Tax=Actinoallomurus bryophytorum TaxID=1490222 RepID=A0A543CNL9_9ACTN|nr:hypothetical protein [Actinoallomurus bryophytorum]TQL98704.1 hypothetical protein FB559_4332 [Actinoallomurus bryophytorum]
MLVLEAVAGGARVASGVQVVPDKAEEVGLVRPSTDDDAARRRLDTAQ